MLTLAERDDARLTRRREAVAELSAQLTGFAQRHGGRFVLYGSTARGQDRHRSDIDLLVEFPSQLRIEAACFAEQLCTQLGLTGDVRQADAASERLIQRARAEGRVLA